MSADWTAWLEYADENLAVARLALTGGYYNACLQNVQQAVEKYLKSALLSKNEVFSRTHSIGTLNLQLQKIGMETGISEEDCELLDTIYVPTKYPLGSALPDFHPDEETGRRCIEIAVRVRNAAGYIA